MEIFNMQYQISNKFSNDLGLPLKEQYPDEMKIVPVGEPFVCNFSGGKDCALALSIACETGNLKGLLHWVKPDEDISRLHVQSKHIVERQAELMDVPLHITEFCALDTWNKYIKVYKKLADSGIKSIVFGDLYFAKNTKQQMLVCYAAGLTPRMPLLDWKYEKIRKEMKKRDIKCIITTIRSERLNDNWLGRIYDNEAYNELQELGVDPFGEAGEFHTTLIDFNMLGKKTENHGKYSVGSNIEMKDGSKTIPIKILNI